MPQATPTPSTILDLLANLTLYPPEKYPGTAFAALDQRAAFTSNGTEWLPSGAFSAFGAVEHTVSNETITLAAFLLGDGVYSFVPFIQAAKPDRSAMAVLAAPPQGVRVAAGIVTVDTPAGPVPLTGSLAGLVAEWTGVGNTLAFTGTGIVGQPVDWRVELVLGGFSP